MPHRPNQLWDTTKALLIAVSIALFIRWMFIEPFRIPSGSMIPTLLDGDQLMVNKLVYGPNVPFSTKKLWLPRPPRRGEVIVFRFPQNPSQDYIKRVVGIPGDTVQIIDGMLYLNGKEVPREYVGPYTPPGEEDVYDLYREVLDGATHQIIQLRHSSPFLSAPANFGPVKVPPNRLFAMGDNRDKSADSRQWGFVPFDNLKGEAMFIHLPLNPENHYLPRWNRFFMWID